MTHLRVNFNSVSLFLYLSAEMLAVFDRDMGRLPEELTLLSPVSKRREEMSVVLKSNWPPVTLFRFSCGSFMAMSHAGEDPLHPKFAVGIDDIYCIFNSS